MNEFDFYDLKPNTKNPISVLNKFSDILPDNPKAYDFFSDLMNNAITGRNTSVGDVTQYIDLYDNRNAKYIKNFPDALGKYYEKVLNTYDALSNGERLNVFNQKTKPQVNRVSILRGTSNVPIGFASQELMSGYPTIGQLSKSILGNGINYLNRISPYVMIYEGLSQPTTTQQKEWDDYNKWQIQNSANPILQGGIEYYD